MQRLRDFVADSMSLTRLLRWQISQDRRLADSENALSSLQSEMTALRIEVSTLRSGR